jgi:tetratricopeptide (TPR) repeat protein
MISNVIKKLKNLSAKLEEQLDEVPPPKPLSLNQIEKIVPTLTLDYMLLPTMLGDLIEKYNGLHCEIEQEIVSRKLMGQIILSPPYGKLLDTDYCKTYFGQQELYLQALAALYFARGEIDKATQAFKSLAQTFSSAFNTICLARCHYALGQKEEMISALEEGHQTLPYSLVLTLELAYSHFLTGNTLAANQYLNLIKSDYLQDPDFFMVREQAQQLTAELAEALEKKLLVRNTQTDIYNDDFTKAVWWGYWQPFNAYNRYQNGNSWLNDLIQERLGKLLEKNTQQIQSLIDFGIMCAEPHYQLAKRFPQVQFIGVDRQQSVKEYNEQAYALPNTQFVTGDILETLPQITQNGNQTVFFHSRTTCFCYPEFVRQLYQECNRLGIEYIVMYEGCALSRDRLEFYDFENLPEDAVSNKSSFFIHHYPKFLEEAGYEVVEHERVGATLLLYDKSDQGGTNFWMVARKKK